jgi:hypothetical protein
VADGVDALVAEADAAFDARHLTSNSGNRTASRSVRSASRAGPPFPGAVVRTAAAHLRRWVAAAAVTGLVAAR